MKNPWDCPISEEVNEKIKKEVPEVCPKCKRKGTVRLNPDRHEYNHKGGMYGWNSKSYQCLACGWVSAS
jgi:hypothetical protein